MVSKSGFFNEKKFDVDETILNFGFVCKGTLRDFEVIRDYTLKFSRARLIYQAKAIEKLFIIRERSEATPKKGRSPQ